MGRIQVAGLGPGLALRATALGLTASPDQPGTITLHSDSSPIPTFPSETTGAADPTGAFITDAYGRPPVWVDDSYLGEDVDITIPPQPPYTVKLGGPPGPPTLPRGAYDPAEAYDRGDLVTYNGYPFASLVDGNHGNQPDISPNFWLQLFDLDWIGGSGRGVDLATQAALPTHTGTTSMQATANGALSVDGVPVQVGWRILVKDEPSANHNWIFRVTATGDAGSPWRLDRTDDPLTTGVQIGVAAGSLNEGRTMTLVTHGGPFTPGVANIAFESAAAGSGAVLNAQNKFTRRQKIAISASARTNLCTRPRPGLAPNLTNYGYDHATLTVNNDYAGTNPVDGAGTAMVGKAVLTGTGAAGFRAASTAAVPDTVACVPGDTLSASYWMQAKAGNVGTQARVVVSWLNASNATISSVSSTQVVPGTGAWVQITSPPTTPAPALTTHAQVSFQASSSSTATTGDTVWFDGCLIEKNVLAAGPYFDGGSASCSWAGTALASTSSSPGEDAYLKFRDVNDTIDVAQIDNAGKGWFQGIDGQNKEATSFLDPTAPQSLITRNYADTHYSGGGAPSHSMPSKVYMTTGREQSIYWENFIRTSGLPITDYQFDVTCALGEQDEFRWFYTPVDADASAGVPWSVTVSYNGVVLLTISTTLVITTAATGGGATRKKVVIGDSLSAVPLTTAGIGWPAELLNLLAVDTHYAMTELGTFSGGETDSALNIRTIRNDAVSGKTFSYFQSDPASPFVFSGSFNFQTYLTNNGYTLGANDWVFFHLGANDVFGPTDDATALANANTALAALAAMITNIKTLGTVPRIVIAMTTPPTHWPDGFGSAYGTGQTRDRYARNRHIWLEQLKATYDAGAVAGVELLPWDLGIDSRNGFPNASAALSARNAETYFKANNGLHMVGSHDGNPTTGYWQAADQAYSYFKSKA